MGLGNLGTGGGNLLNGKEGLSFPTPHQIPGGVFAQSGNGYKGRQDFPVDDQKLGGVALVHIDWQEGKAPEVVFIDHFHGRQQVLILIGGIFIGLNGIHVGHNGFHALGHEHRVKAALLAASIKIGGIKGQRMVDLEPGNTEGHHYIGHGVGLGEQIFDLLAGANIPIRYPRVDHFLLRALRQTPALSDRLHDFKGTLLRHPTGNQIQHNIVTAADGLVNRCGFGCDQVLGVAQPNVCAVGEA